MRRAILTLLICSTAGCGITDPGKVTLHLAGTVTEKATGKPVTGALIELFAPCFIIGCGSGQDLVKTTSDAQGHYAVKLSVDTCTRNGFGLALSASGSGFETNAQQVECNDSRQEIDFTLAPTAAP